MSSTVLIVDDELQILELVQTVARRCDCEAVTADSLAAGLEKYEPEAFVGAILDFNLGAENVLPLIHKIREEEADLPVIVMTGLVDQNRAAAFEAGASEVFGKPVDMSVLMTTLRSFRERVS